MNAETKIKMTRWNHPDWGMALFTEPGWTVDVLKSNDFLIDLDPTLCTHEDVEMTQAEIEALPEWDG